MIERLLSQVNTIKNDVAKLTRRMVSTADLDFSSGVEDKLFLDQFPFCTKESDLACEQILQKDSDIQEKLVCIS